MKPRKGHPRKGRFARVGENLYRYTANKKYYGVFRYGGQQVWRSLKTTDRDLAVRRLREEIAKAGRVDPQVGQTTLTELLGLYEEALQRLDAHTIQTRMSILKIFKATWKHGLAIPVKAVGAQQVELWLAQHRKRLKKRSFNEYIRFVRQVFEIATKAKVIAESPAAGIKLVRPETPIRETPTWDQFQKIVADIRSQRFSAEAEDSADLVEFMGLAGVGTAECANLLGNHVDFTGNRIALYRKKTDTGYTIPIFPQVLALLKTLESKGRIAVGELVFRVKDPKKALRNACKRLGFPHFSARSLRRCFITRAVEKGIDFKTIAAWQGHRDGGVLIAKTYSHLRNEHSDAMAKKMG